MPREVSKVGPGSAGPGTGEQPNLDLLRALAVLLVLADHVLETIGHSTGREFHPYDWYLGRLGVLLFFVHTCYVLMASMERLGTSGISLIRTFYVRRAFRIYPLALLCIALVLLFSVPPVPWRTFEAPDAADLLSNALLTTNLTASTPVMGPMWSLPIEVQMYIVLPFIFLYADQATDLKKICGIYVVALALAFVLPGISGRIAGAQYGPCFMAGIIAFALRTRVQPAKPGGLWSLFLAGVVVAYIAIEEFTPGIHHVALQAAVCLVVGLAIPVFRQSGATLLNRSAHLVAKYSYGVYLFHCVALWVAYVEFKSASPIAQPMIALAVLVALSVASYHWLEAPAIRLGARISARRAPRPVPVT